MPNYIRDEEGKLIYQTAEAQEGDVINLGPDFDIDALFAPSIASAAPLPVTQQQAPVAQPTEAAPLPSSGLPQYKRLTFDEAPPVKKDQGVIKDIGVAAARSVPIAVKTVGEAIQGIQYEEGGFRPTCNDYSRCSSRQSLYRKSCTNRSIA